MDANSLFNGEYQHIGFAIAIPIGIFRVLSRGYCYCRSR
jgi:hypothetical protein